MNKKLPCLISENEITTLVHDLASRINHDYSNLASAGSELIVVVTLKGALFFAADLIRKLSVPLIIDFVRVASYGDSTQSSGKVRMTRQLEIEIRDRDVLVLDEIVDSGRTLRYLIDRLTHQSPKSLKVCSLLSKSSRREVEVSIDYLGREVEDKFLVGYGLDHAERYRNLPFIAYI